MGGIERVIRRAVPWEAVRECHQAGGRAAEARPRQVRVLCGTSPQRSVRPRSPLERTVGDPAVPMTLEERERFKRAEAAEKQRQQEIRVRHGGLLHVADTDPYEETPAEEPVDTLVNKPSVGILSVLVRVGLFVLIALGFVVYRSGQPGRVVAIAGLNVPLDLKVAGVYQNLLGGGRDSPGAVAVYLHHDARSAADWSGFVPFADAAPNAVPCGMSQRGTRLDRCHSPLPDLRGAPRRWAAPRPGGAPAPRRREAKG